jgi:sugar O-acyltransferase (sialic acid O-acetyltransferase NeuD family)
MDYVIVFGAGGHAKVVIDVIESQAKFKIAAVYDADLNKSSLLGYPIFHDIGRIKEMGINNGIVAIGHNTTRKTVALKILEIMPDFNFVTAVHPFTAIAHGVVIDKGSVIMAGCCINADSTIGMHCIINTRASLDHENLISDYVNVSPGAATGGNVSIGESTFIGLGVNIIQKISIGSNSFIGAGSLVVKQIPCNVLAYGMPAKIIRPISVDDNLI